MTQIHPEQCVDNTQTPSGGSSANQINISTNLGPATLIVVCVLAAIIGACGLVMGLNLAKQAEMDRDFREASTRLMLNERRLMDKEAYDILNGSKYFSDDAHGPTGNLERMKPQEQNHGRR
jgi:hypothetical protein